MSGALADGSTGGGGSSKGNQSKTGYLGGKSMSAEDLNSSIRADIGTSYLRGPKQDNYVGMGTGTRNAVKDLRSATSGYDGILNDAYDANRGILNDGGLTADQTGAIDYTRGVMQGGDDDPAFQRLRQNAMDDARTAVNRQFGASGRFGSSMHAGDVSRGIFDAAAGLDYQNLQRQDAAAQGLFGMGQTGQANTFAAADRAGGLFENMLMPAQTRIQANSLFDADKRAKASFDPNYEHLLKYQGLLGNNAAGPQPAKQPGFLDYAGLGLGLLSAFA